MGKADFEFENIGNLGDSISVQEMKGNGETYFRITKMYKSTEGNWKPTNKGVSIPLTETQALKALLEKFIKKHGLSEQENIEKTDLVSDVKDL